MQVLLRADASLDLGSGHLVRCITLADTLKSRGAVCTFACAQIPDALAARITAGGHRLQRLGAGATDAADDAAALKAQLGPSRFDWLIVDHYGLGEAWESHLRGFAERILVIDDLANRAHACDILLDQNLFQDAATRYAGLAPGGCRLLLGPRFALLRAEFTACRTQLASRSRPVQRILISFGGADAQDYTSVALRAVQGIGRASLHVDVVIGADHVRKTELEQASANGLFKLHVQTTRMAELMAASDLLVGAGGSATWERCCLGLPALAVAVAENQRAVVREAALAGVLLAVGDGELDADELTIALGLLIDDQHLRESMSVAGMSLVDGRGASRVVREMGVFGVKMRLATSNDAENLYEWRNHPGIRAASHSSEPLNWGDHVCWLEETLKDPGKVLLIGESGGQPAGVVRFDVADATARISIYMVPDHAPDVRGADVLGAAEHWMRSHRPTVSEFTAEVLAGNVPSHRLFQSAGFDRSAASYCKRVAR